MYMLEKAKIIKFIACSVFLATNLMAENLEKNIDGSVIYPIKNNKYTSYHVNTNDTTSFKYGRVPTQNEINAWNKDVMPDGTGLPVGSGSVSDGEELYDEKCALCHGDFGAGGKGYPTLAGGKGTLKNQLLKEGDLPPNKTIGSYWPYVSTLFWYIQSAMPFTAPKSLSDDETYAITAYLLSVNDIKVDGKSLDDDFVLSDKNFLKTQMPNKDGFYAVSPDRHDLKEMRPALAQGVRCMKDCEFPGIVEIKHVLDGYYPPLSTKRDLPKTSEKTASKQEQIYKESCAMCHANDALGAPVFGNKEEWAKVLEQGIDTVYKNAINGLNAMPAKGGNDSLSDDEMKKVVDFMIESAK